MNHSVSRKKEIGSVTWLLCLEIIADLKPVTFRFLKYINFQYVQETKQKNICKKRIIRMLKLSQEDWFMCSQTWIVSFKTLSPSVMLNSKNRLILISFKLQE